MSSRKRGLPLKLPQSSAALGKRPNTPAGTRATSLTVTTAPSSPVVSSSPAQPTPSAVPVEPPTTSVRGPMSTKTAIKELSSRGLIQDSSHPAFEKLIEILLNFTGKETTGEPEFEAVWEVPVAVGTLLKDALGKIVSEATADATFHRYTSVRNEAKENAKKEILEEMEEEKKKIEEKREIVSALEDELAQGKLELAGERGRLVEEMRKHELERASLDSVAEGMKGTLRRLEEERGKWAKLREERSLAPAKDNFASTATTTNPDTPLTWGAQPEGDGGWGSELYGGRGDTGNESGQGRSYAAAVARGGVWPPPEDATPGSSLTEKQIQEGAERLRRGEERRERISKHSLGLLMFQST
ncbi:Reverse transcriptase from transposon X-element protein [Ceratobasidium sp. AG-Ba]|nr:Reverse transcriptase from transposon X-element protein [Ceratobasidium sp. AG-Ba]